jgi:hypothetical protein
MVLWLPVLEKFDWPQDLVSKLAAVLAGTLVL